MSPHAWPTTCTVERPAALTAWFTSLAGGSGRNDADTGGSPPNSGKPSAFRYVSMRTKTSGGCGITLSRARTIRDDCTDWSM